MCEHFDQPSTEISPMDPQIVYNVTKLRDSSV
jgi:hypothetical protein